MLRTGLDIVAGTVAGFFKPNPIDKTISTSTVAEVKLDQLVEKTKALEDATLTKSELETAMSSSDDDSKSIDDKKTENKKMLIVD